MYQQLDYYYKNREKVIKKNKLYRDQNREKISMRRKIAYRNKREKIIESARKYYLENKDKILEKGREYRKKNHAKILMRNRNRKNAIRSLNETSDITHQYLREIVESTSKCPICERRMDMKHVDHIIPIVMGGTHTKDNVRVICRKCNLSRPKDGRDLL